MKRLVLPPVWLLWLALTCSALIAVHSGAVPLRLPAILSGTLSPSADYVLWHLRLPRLVFAGLIGASLGLSGALTQGLFRNPLADPGLLGVSAGAACAAALTIVVLGSADANGWALPLAANARPWLLPAAAFGGALGVCLVLEHTARWLTPDSIGGLLLTGVAFNALAGAIIGLCTYLANDTQLRSLSFWTLGSLASASWYLVAALATLLLGATLFLRRHIPALNALALGPAAARHVGVDVQGLRTRLVWVVAVLAGFSVAWCGMIGFIGLVAPHLVRMWTSADQRQVIPLSMLMGALLLIGADTLARTVAIPAEVPVGLFSALMGSPFFLWLLRSRRGAMA